MQNDRDKISLGSKDDVLSRTKFKSKSDKMGACVRGRDGKPDIKAYDITTTMIRWSSDDGQPKRLVL
jgi:hypothetical protein